MYYIYIYICTSQWLSGKKSACNTGDSGDMSLIPGLGRFPGGGHGNPLHILA